MLPHAKDEMYQIVVRRWECSYAMMSVALDEAMSLRSAGELVCARQQVSIAAGLLARLAPSLISLCDTLSSRGQRVTRLPVVQPMNADFFRGDTGQSAASWNQILHHVLFSARSRFFHKLRILSHTLATLEYEFEDAAGDISRNLATQPGDCWQRLDNLHYDFNTCLREVRGSAKVVPAHPAGRSADVAGERARRSADAAAPARPSTLLRRVRFGLAETGSDRLDWLSTRGARSSSD